MYGEDWREALFGVFPRLVRIVYEISCEIIIVGRHVDKAMSRKVEQYDFLFSCLLAFVGLIDCRCDGMT